MNREKKLEVYYDGSCSACTAFVQTNTSAQKELFITRDVTKGELPKGVSFDRAMRDMYVVEQDGTMHVGGEAILRILEERPRLRFLARIGRLPGVRQLVRVLYRLVATHRYRIPAGH